jgi:hypothetical protein
MRYSERKKEFSSLHWLSNLHFIFKIAVYISSISVINVWSTEPIRKGHRRGNQPQSPNMVCLIVNVNVVCLNTDRIAVER